MMFYTNEMKVASLDGITIAKREPVMMGAQRWTRKAINAEIDAYFGDGASEYFESWTRSELMRDLFVYLGTGTKRTLRALDEIKAAHVIAFGRRLVEG